MELDRRSLRTGRRTVARFVSVVVGLAVVGCTTDTSATVDPPSGALIPDDERFAASFRVESLDDGPNHSWQSNASPEFDPDIDPDLFVAGFQVDDPELWPGDAEGYTERQREALGRVLDDSEDHARADACEAVSDEPLVVSCTYDVDEVEPMPLLVRRIDDSALVAIGTGAALDFLTGDFRAAP